MSTNLETMITNLHDEDNLPKSKKYREKDAFKYDPRNLTEEVDLYGSVAFKDGEQTVGSVNIPEEKVEAAGYDKDLLIEQASRFYRQATRAEQALKKKGIRSYAKKLRESQIPLLRFIAVQLASHLVEVYAHQLEKALSKKGFETLAEDRAFLKLEGEEEVGLTLTEEDLVSKAIARLEELLEEQKKSIWEDFAHFMWTHMVAWALQRMEEEIEQQRLLSMNAEEYNQTFDKYFNEDPQPFEGRATYLLSLFSQQATEGILEQLDVPKLDLQKLEVLIGLRPKNEDEAIAKLSKLQNEILIKASGESAISTEKWVGESTPSTRAAFSRALKRLENPGLIIRQSVREKTSPKRTTYIKLTKLGNAVIKRLTSRH